jgi:hypothetical protein
MWYVLGAKKCLRVLVEEPERKTPLARHKSIWKDIIKRNLKQMN